MFSENSGNHTTLLQIKRYADKPNKPQPTKTYSQSQKLYTKTYKQFIDNKIVYLLVVFFYVITITRVDTQCVYR